MCQFSPCLQWQTAPNFSGIYRMRPGNTRKSIRIVKIYFMQLDHWFIHKKWTWQMFLLYEANGIGSGVLFIRAIVCTSQHASEFPYILESIWPNKNWVARVCYLWSCRIVLPNRKNKHCQSQCCLCQWFMWRKKRHNDPTTAGGMHGHASPHMRAPFLFFSFTDQRWQMVDKRNNCIAKQLLFGVQLSLIPNFKGLRVSGSSRGWELKQVWGRNKGWQTCFLDCCEVWKEMAADWPSTKWKKHFFRDWGATEEKVKGKLGEGYLWGGKQHTREIMEIFHGVLNEQDLQ